jgi:acetyl esterase/lipase
LVFFLVYNCRLSLKKEGQEVSDIQHPDHIMDVGKSIEFLYNNNNTATTLYNPKKMYLVGHSAGAHIASMLLLDTSIPYHQYIQGIIGVSGIYDIPLLVKTFPSYMDFIEQAFCSKEGFFVASPISKKSSVLENKPIIIAHSQQDTLINDEQAEVMTHHLKVMNANVTLDMTLTGDHYEIMKTDKLAYLVQSLIQ